MTGTYSIVGEAISVSGILYRPPFQAVNPTLNASGVWLEAWRTGGAIPLTGAAQWTTGDIVPLTIATSELTALVAGGRATQAG